MVSSSRTKSPDIDWERIDKSRFFVMGTGVFSGITTCLFPLSVIKTRMMTLDSPQGGNVGLQATVKAVRSVISQEGVWGLYRGFPAAVTGFLPARIVYLSTLEMVKSKAKKLLKSKTTFDETKVIAASSFLSGACASLASQTIFVPVDVVSQQQMISTRQVSVVDKVKGILRNEGIRGFYRGYWMSVSLFVPGSAIWWGSYSVYKDQYWKLFVGANQNHMSASQPGRGGSSGDLNIASSTPMPLPEHGSWRLIGIQAISAVSAGCTTSFVTTPLDVIKTRYQTADRKMMQSQSTSSSGTSSSSTIAARASAYEQVSSLFKKEGFWGFYRGLFPRMASSSLWGTSMILAYEFLKRNCILPED